MNTGKDILEGRIGRRSASVALTEQIYKKEHTNESGKILINLVSQKILRFGHLLPLNWIWKEEV